MDRIGEIASAASSRVSLPHTPLRSRKRRVRTSDSSRRSYSSRSRCSSIGMRKEASISRRHHSSSSCKSSSSRTSSCCSSFNSSNSFNSSSAFNSSCSSSCTHCGNRRRGRRTHRRCRSDRWTRTEHSTSIKHSRHRASSRPLFRVGARPGTRLRTTSSFGIWSRRRRCSRQNCSFHMHRERSTPHRAHRRRLRPRRHMQSRDSQHFDLSPQQYSLPTTTRHAHL
mmetsp:Transcript_26227/g.50961  ORF Transcript_26227/g.50961 Transcript_26227/m.50961 type:complete len:225 (+) Transcript_26227:140-814(+)